MKLIRTYVLVISFGVVFSSCAVFKDDSNRQVRFLQKSDHEKANGQFANYPTSVQKQIRRDLYPTARKYDFTLWEELSGRSQYKDSIQVLKDQKVILNFVSNKGAVAKLYFQGEVIDEKRLKGHIKDGYFYYKRSFILIPFFPVLFRRDHYWYRLGITSDDSLVIDNAWNYWMFALFAGDYSKGQKSLEFKRNNL